MTVDSNSELITRLKSKEDLENERKQQDAMKNRLNGCFMQVKGFMCCLRGVEGTTRLRRHSTHSFEEVVKFLREIPLFANDFPSDDLPNLALAFYEQNYRPGEVIVKEGSYPTEETALFVVTQGDVRLLKEQSDSSAESRGRLQRGDYFGGRTVVENRPYFTTAKAGDEGCKTLTITRQHFGELGLHKLNFPARGAVYERNGGTPLVMTGTQVGIHQSMHAEDFKFVAKHLCLNSHLRALYNDTVLERVAKRARRVEVPPGTVLYHDGDPVSEFYVVRSGTVMMRRVRNYKEMGADGTLNSVKRRLRKQAFLQKLLLEEDSEESIRSESEEGGELCKRQTCPDITASSVSSRRVSVPAADMKLPYSPRTPKGANRSASTRSKTDHQVKACRGRSRSVCLEDAFNFKVGDPVIVDGEDNSRLRNVGRVVRVMQNENVVVDFPLIGAAVHKASKLRRAPSTTYKPELGEGAILGELSLLYNLPRLATCAASEKSNVILYAISRSDFEEELVRSGSRHRDQEKVNEWAALLGEVRVLSSLVNAEIMELARMADGETSFAPNERVIQRGKVRELRQWYVIAGGTAVLSRDNTVVAVLGRGAHFGERSLLHGGGIAEVDVDAGERGMLCLCINGRILNSLQHCFLNAGAVGSTVEEYECYKAKQGALQSKFHIDIQMLRSVSVLGQGNFGMVTLAVDDKTGEQFALKRVSKRRVRQTKSQKYIQNERDLMSMVGSKFIIKLFCTYQDSDYVYMLQESALGGSLEALNEQYHAQKMDSHTRAWLSATQYFVGCVVMGLRHLHKRHIVHRDLKLGNILLTQDGSPKICDFGFARFVLDKTYTVLGTPEYMAPEIIEFPHAHNQLVDYWALGVFTFELLSGTVPWEDTSEEGGHFLYRIRQLQKQRPTPRIQDIYVPAVATDFVHNLLNQDPDRRLGRRGFNEVKNHNWFRHDFFSFEDLDKGGMKLPQIPVDLPGAQDLDPVTPSLLEAPEGDGVFRCLETNDWGLQNVLFEDNAMTALRHRKSEIRSDNVVAMTKSSKIVRMTVDWKPSDCRGPVYFGLTSDPDDDHTFKSGCCVRIAPEEVSDPESPTRPSRYDVCSQDCGDNAITLSIENSDVAVYNCGQKVYSMNPNQKGIGSTFKSKARVYGKVFLNGGSDTVEVYAYEEFPDDGSEWDKDFKMAGHFDASNGMKGSFGQLSKLGKLGESTASIASLGEESVKEDLYKSEAISEYKSEAISEKDGESSIETEPEPESVGKDVLSLIGLLASIEKGSGETDLKQAIQAAYAAVESSFPNLAPLEPLLYDDMKPFLVSQQLLLLGGEQASSERFERFTQTTPRDERGVFEQNRVMESGQVEELSWKTLAAVPKQEMNKLFLESHVLEAVSLSSRAPSKCTTHPCTSRTEPDSSRAPSTCMTEPGPVEELPKSPGRPPRRASSANVPSATCATRTFYLDALPKEIYRPRQLSQTAREELEGPQSVRRQASAPPRATSSPLCAPYREILEQTRDSARSTSHRETLVQPRDLGVPRRISQRETLVQSRDMGSARSTSQQREVLVRSLAQSMTAPPGSSSCSSLPVIRQRLPPGGVPDHIASRGKYPHLQSPIQARTGKGVAANNVQKPAPVSAARQHLMPIHPAVQGRVALARS